MMQHCSQREIEKFILEDNAKILQKYLRERDLVPKGQLVEIGFEQLENSPLETMARIYRDLHLDNFENARPAMQAYLDSVKQYKRNKYRPLPPAKLRKLNAAWDFWFKEFAYQVKE
jgi:hypothetical protein